jgi:TolA-binding protein
MSFGKVQLFEIMLKKNEEKANRKLQRIQKRTNQKIEQMNQKIEQMNQKIEQMIGQKIEAMDERMKERFESSQVGISLKTLDEAGKLKLPLTY